MVLGFGRALAVGLVGLGAPSFMPANAVHNAGITWGSGDGPILGARIDGSRRHVLVPQFADSEGDPAWTRDGRTIAFYAQDSDNVWINLLRPGEPKSGRPIRWRCGQPFVQYPPSIKRWLRRARCRFLPPDYRSPPNRGIAYLRQPTWSPDATRIAVSDSWTVDTPEASISIVSLATKKWTSLTKPRRHESDVDPAWSPDGRVIAYARSLHEGTPTIVLVRPDGSGARPLTQGRSPSWSPDGKRLAFALGGSVYEIRADGRGRKRILGGLRNPVVRWSPDGRKLLYTSDLGSRSDVWTVDVDGTHPRRILNRVTIMGIAWRPAAR
jgi:hypothetical protein